MRLHDRCVLWFLCTALLSLNLAERKAEAKTKTTKESKSILGERGRALAFALKNNPSLRAFRARIQRVQAAHAGSRVFPNNPVLSGGGGAQFPLNSVGQGSSALPRLGVDLSLRLPIGGRWGSLQKRRALELRWYQKQWAFLQFKLKLRVHMAIHRMAVAWQVQKKRRAMASFFLRLESLAKKRIQHGSATQLDLQLVQNSRLQAEQSALAALLQYKLVRQQLKTLLGWTSMKPMPWSFRDLPTLPNLPKESKMLAGARQNHFQIALAQLAIAQAKAGLTLSKARAIPDLTVSLGYALEDNNHIVRGSLSIPLPVFWRNQSKIGQGRAHLRHARLLLKRQRFLIGQRIQRAYRQFQMRTRMERLLQKQFKTLKSHSKLIERGLRQGGFSVFKVFTTQRSVIQSQILYLRNIQKVHDSYIQLCGAAGILPVYKKRILPSLNLGGVK